MGDYTPVPEHERDDMLNNLLVTGGVLAALMSMPTLGKVEPIKEGNNYTNQIIIHPEWMKSSYKVTVERVQDQEEDTDG